MLELWGSDAFEVLAPRAPSVPVVVHVPHAATRIPVNVRSGIDLDAEELAEELRVMTDHRTDALWSGGPRVGAAVFVNRLSRLVVDPERFREGDDMEPLGMGPVYTARADGSRLRGGADRERLLATYFDPYTEAFAALVDGVLATHGRCTIIDAHSYPRTALPYEDASRERPEVCIGTSSVHTQEWLRDVVIETCDDHGLRYAFDTPFAGVYIPRWAYESGDDAVRGVMIELRRDTYLDEVSATPGEGFARVHRFCDDLLERIAAIA